jgi:hypothetical protein
MKQLYLSFNLFAGSLSPFFEGFSAGILWPR